MKWLILLLLIVIAVVWIAARYRRQIQTAIYLLQMFRKMRGADKGTEKQIRNIENSKNVPLVRCAKCGTWIPQTKALNLRSKAVYCSTVCMENAVNVQ
jgi:Sec-independent protein translocase protein TatA